MLGRKSLKLELTPSDPEIERSARENLRTTADFENSDSDNSFEMGGWVENLEIEAPKTLRELFAPIATDTPSCIACDQCHSF
jgi:hypothetical protein